MTTLAAFADQAPRIRVAIWLFIGAGLGLPVDEMLESINLQFTAAK